MNRYTNTWDSIETRAASAHDAANIIARRIYGRRGVCASLRHDCRSEDNRNHTYEAFVGKPSGNATSGRNIWIYERVSQ